MKKFILTKLLMCSIALCGNHLHAQVTELWGTNWRAGDDNFGRIIAVNDAGTTVSEVHGFPATFPGGSSYINEMIVYNNMLYGTSNFTGKYNNGIIYKYDPVTKVSTKLHDFQVSEGRNPQKGLTLLNGKMYGITSNGAANNLGSIFELDLATNVFVKKFDLNSTTGGFTSTNLSAFNGKLYGVTGSGAGAGFGAIIEFDPVTNTCVSKINLTNDATIGRQCFTGLTLMNNKFYGAMQFGGPAFGVIFEWDPATNIYVIKYSLQPNGPRNFTGPFTVAGNLLYAAPNQGPGDFGNGCIVEFNPATSDLTVKVPFDFATGAGSYGGLTLYNNKYYGTNTTGGANSLGAYFEWDPATNVITNRQAATTATGDQPGSSPVLVNDKLYMTTYGNTMVSWDVAANTLTKEFTFGASKGERIETRVIFNNGKVYGVTSLGGDNSKGVLFSKDVNTGVYSILHHFNKPGFNSSTHSQLHLNNGIIYGSTDASASTYGVIYQYDINTSTYTERYNLTLAGGYNIKGTWIFANNKYYGIAVNGGASFGGTVFSWDPATNIFTTLSNISGYKMGGGFTEVGGFLFTPITITSSGNPAVFKFNPANNTFILAATSNTSLGSGNGGEEFTLLNGKLYTGYPAGTSNGYGSIVEFDPTNNIFINKRNFSSAFPEGPTNTGASSNGILLPHNGDLYGFTTAGGLNGSGTTFKYNPVTGVFTKLEDIIPVGSSISYGNGFTIVQRTGVLPIQLNYFTAVKENKTNAKISWQTALEQNNKGFSIQRSPDGRSFENIGWKAATNTDRNTAYTFIDAQPFSGINYYRFEQWNLDGTSTFSPVKQLDFGKVKAAVSTYPNPVLDQLVINNNFSPAKLTLVDSKGATIKFMIIRNGQTTVNLAALSRGIYYYNIIFEDGTTQVGSINKN